jgi:hypothetical protein
MSRDRPTPSSIAWSTTPTASSSAATACDASGRPRWRQTLDLNRLPDGNNNPPADEQPPGRHQSEWPADMNSEYVADFASEQAADIVGIHRSALMNIGEASSQSSVSARIIRNYEMLGLT